MSWLENIRQKPNSEKIKIIWIVCSVTVAILIIVWIIVGGIKKDTQKDLRLFESINQSFQGFSKSVKNLPPQP
jgi:hypothetical protein